MTAVRPMSFVGFCERVLRLHLTPGQRVLCKVAFDGVDPCDLEGEERDLARQLFGDVDEVRRRSHGGSLCSSWGAAPARRRSQQRTGSGAW